MYLEEGYLVFTWVESHLKVVLECSKLPEWLEFFMSRTTYLKHAPVEAQFSLDQCMRCAGDHPPGSGCDFVERAWLWIVSPFSCVETKEGVGREASSFSRAHQEGREGEGVVRTCGAQVAQFMDSHTFPLCNSRMKSSETCPSPAMLDLTVFLISWSTSRLLKVSVSTSCVSVSDSSPAAGHGV